MLYGVLGFVRGLWQLRIPLIAVNRGVCWSRPSEMGCEIVQPCNRCGDILIPLYYCYTFAQFENVAICLARLAITRHLCDVSAFLQLSDVLHQGAVASDGRIAPQLPGTHHHLNRLLVLVVVTNE